MTTTSLYETDFYSWTQQQAHLIRTGEISVLDFENILEEIESMGRAEKRSLLSRLAVLLMHLIKWQYQPEHRSKSWEVTIIHQRTAIFELLQESPGLKNMLDDTLLKAWARALREAASETGIAKRNFPPDCPWSVEQCLSDDFWPEPENHPAPEATP